MAGVVRLNVTGVAGDGWASGPGWRWGSVVVEVDVVEVDVVEVEVAEGRARVVATVVIDADRAARDVGAVMERPSTCTGLAVEATEPAPGNTLASPIADAIRPSATSMVARRWRVMGGGRDGRALRSVRTGHRYVTVQSQRDTLPPMPDAVPDMRNWGLLRPGELERVVILSPHLDDAVLGCGRFMAAHSGVTVLTVYAGAPEAYPEPMSRWDTLSGFTAGDEVLGVRRSEDAAALRELGAAPRWLDFVEHQYLDRSDWVGATETHETLEAELRALTPTAIFAPFGLANPDHGATHDAAMMVRSRYFEPSWSSTKTSATCTYPACSLGE